jgi:hypothetical protein
VEKPLFVAGPVREHPQNMVSARSEDICKLVTAREILTGKVDVLEDSNARLAGSIRVVENVLAGFPSERLRALKCFDSGFVQPTLFASAQGGEEPDGIRQIRQGDLLI